MSENNYEIKLRAVLDKIKSIANIKSDIKAIEPKLPKVKIQGILDKTATQKELNFKIKSIKPKVKVDADTTQAENKIKKIGKQKNKTTITPTVDNTQVVSGLKQAQKETKTLWERFTSGIIGANLVRMAVNRVTQAIKEAIATVKELDTIKTNIQMVSGTSDSGVNAMMSSYNAMAKDLSSTTKDVAEAANEFLRMGESLENTNELIRSSQILSKVGMIESADAASYLISSLKGYQVAAEDSIDIVSKLTSVDLEAAVSAGGLAEAISRCSNIANNSGTSMDRLIGYTAAVGEVTQESMSVIGNAFKSIYSRMNNIKIGKFIDDETGESLSDTEAVLNKLGIQLRDTQNSYRDFDEVLDDIGGRWSSLTQVEQNALSVAMAGTMQRERFIVLMNNYSKALEYSEVATNSAGNALERYSVYQDSLEAKTNELTAAMESLYTNIVSEELYSGIIEATTGLVEFLDKSDLLKASLAGLVAMGVSKAIISMGAGFITAAKSAAQLGAAMALFDKGTSAQNLKAIGAACKGLSDRQLKLILSTKGLEYADRQLILAGMGVAESEREQMLTTLGFAAAEDKATVSTLGLGAAFKGLGASIKAFALSHPILTAIAAIGVAIYGAVKAYDALTVSLEEQKEKLQETKAAYENVKSELQEVEDELQSTKEDKVEELANTPNLSWVEQEELDRLREVTKELELQKQLKQDMQLESAEDLYIENVKTFNKEFKSSYGNASVEEFKEQLALGYIGIGQLDYKNITDLVSALQYLNEEKVRLTDESEIAEYEKWIDDLTDSVKSNGQEYLSSLSEYKQNILEIASIRDLTKDEQDFYDYLLSMQKMIYEFYSPATWNGLEFDSIFNTDGIEKTKEELAAMYKSGELSSAEMLEQFPKLYDAIKESEIIAGEGSDVFKEFFNEIAALAEEQGDLINDVLGETKVSLSISDTVSQLNTQLKPTFDSLKSVYNDIFTDDGFALNSIDILSTCNSIRSKLDELNEMEGITVDFSSYEDFVRVLRDTESTETDVEQAFDSLATSITQAALSGTEDFATMKAALEDLGVVNNEIVAFDALASNAEMLEEALTQANVSMDDFIVNTEDGSAAATKAGLAFLKEKVGAENCAEALGIIAFHKQLCNEQGINTAAEVANLKTLAENAGYTGEVIQHLTELEQIYQEVASGTINPIVIGAKIGRAAMLQAMIQGAATKINYEAVYKPMEKAASKAGSSAGKAAGESYADALKDKLSDLNNVISYIGDTIGGQIDLFEDQKDAAVDALKAEKEAAEDVLEVEKALVQEKIDAKQAEIDVIEEAAKARKNELDLQKAQYDLERMQNQKTMLVNYMPDTVVI